MVSGADNESTPRIALRGKTFASKRTTRAETLDGPSTPKSPPTYQIPQPADASDDDEIELPDYGGSKFAKSTDSVTTFGLCEIE